MKLKILSVILLGCSATFAADYNLQTLEKAHGMFRAATNATMYAAAAQQYELLVKEEGIRNGDLFYTLGNSWFLAGDIGRAILNYRRAEQYLPNNADVRHNLNAALEQRSDLIPEKEPHPVAAKLFGWHFNTSPAFRWWLFAACWLVAWGAWVWLGRTRKKEARITGFAASALSIALMVSILAETISKLKVEPGVITASEVLARKGDGEIYAPAFLDPLHSGTEFQRVEDRGHWWLIRLVDGQECWIPSSSAASVSL
jgi:tetratricopeptide (TPR) repeat protein